MRRIQLAGSRIIGNHYIDSEYDDQQMLRRMANRSERHVQPLFISLELDDYSDGVQQDDDDVEWYSLWEDAAY